MRWRLRISDFDCEANYQFGLVHKVADFLSRLLYPFNTLVRERKDDKISTFESNLAALE